ncbi:MAG: bifunctional hydroxymethylpyrimidine kinase/phosphomethylpyrimidine kinase, partial [Clostridia bacterium]|nr:bifunctional hydroxymethylpyrimidine kinase/phosphomethylpyrimidine kinase [Clostridia bacterium]
TEAEFYSGIAVSTEADAEKAAKVILDKGVSAVIITLGKKGAFYMTEREKGIVPAPSVKAVDTTGAGDAFNGALATRLSLKDTLPEAIRFANAFAALSVTKKGTCDSMPTLEETLSFMKEQTP